MISTLSQLVAQVESGNVPHAMRFEPAWRYTTPEIVARCIRAHAPAYMNEATARAICAMSLGKYQIMLSVLYELGYTGTMLKFMSDEALQDLWFTMYVRARGINYSLTDIVNDDAMRLRFALRYNGDAKTYAAKLMSVYLNSKKV